MDLRFIVVAVVLALSFEDTVSQGDISDGIESRIVGGEEAFPGDFPYQVSVRSTNASRPHICGGIIVSPKHILTAAQCINFKPSLDTILKPADVIVYVGSVSQTSGGSYYTVATIQVHNSYSGLNLQNDIALLKLSKTLDTNNSSIQIIPMRQKTTPTAENCVTTGWGTLSQGATVLPDVLRFIELPIFDHAECKLRYSVGGVSAVNDKMICLGIVNDSRGVCQGDAGGPLVCNGSLAGITSFNAGCDNVNPTVFTEVFKHQDWIKNAMNGALPTLPLSLTFFALLHLTLILLK